MKTKSLRKEDVKRKWYVVDANDKIVGRMCTEIASRLRGKHKPTFTPHIDCGDCIIVINADKVRFTGNKMTDKEYISYSGYPGGQKRRTAKEMMAKKPFAIVEKAVKGMLPKTKLGRQQFTNLFVYAGSDHPHSAQQPETLEI